MDSPQRGAEAPDADQGTENTARQKLHSNILQDVKLRNKWETKMVDFYRMRHQGIRRKQKPWNNAADLHFPLIDTNIEKLKPLFFQQIVGMDEVATFVPMRQQLASSTATASGWFDYKLRERTNLQTESLTWIDYALMSGRGPIKVTWNAKKAQVEYTAIDPMYLIVPPHTRDIQDADRVVHVMPMSIAAYKRSGLYKADDATMEKITSADDDVSIPGMADSASARRLREGITHDTRTDFIILWEVYERDEAGKWIMYTFCPTAEDLDLREPMELPYEHGMVPFVDFAYEIKDSGWYSPRGVAEILAPFEAALCHTWNQKHDSMQLFNKPVFRSERDVPNTMNLRVGPGQILPVGLQPVTMPAPPMSFDEEMTGVRSIAEQRVSNPDYGMGQVIDTKNRRTATEISAIGAQSQQAGDLRARLFRMALGRLYKMSWELLLQYDAQDLAYRFQEDSLQVDIMALHSKYHIEPKGGVNEVNKQLLLQKAIQRKQIFEKSPWISQPELDKSILELDDPSLIKRVFTDPNQKQIDEQSDETKNIPALLIGGKIAVKQGDNYSLRIGTIMQFLQKTFSTGGKLPPEGSQAIVTRLGDLIQADASVDKNGAAALGKQVQQFLMSVGMIPDPSKQPQGQRVPVHVTKSPPASAPQPQAALPKPEPKRSIKFIRDAKGRIATAELVLT